MNKKGYEKPTMTVVELQYHCHILAGSVEASRSGYGTAEEVIWE